MAKRVSIVLYVCAWRSMDVKAIARQIWWKSHGTELILMIFQSKAPYHSTILQKMERLQKLHAWSIWNIEWKSAEHHQVNIFWGIISILSKITTKNSKHRKKRVLFILKIFHSAKCNTAKWKHLHRHVYWDSALALMKFERFEKKHPTRKEWPVKTLDIPYQIPKKIDLWNRNVSILWCVWF